MKPTTTLSILCSMALWVSYCHADPPAKLPEVTPESVGLETTQLNLIDDVVAQGMKEGRLCGAVVLVGHQGKIVFHRAYGHRQVKPTPELMTKDTLFDLASITKPVATATSIMILIEQGKISLHDKVAKYIPEFAQNGKHDITIHQLLIHQGGLIPDNSIKDYADGPAKSFERIYTLKTINEPGTTFKYTDVGFIMLAKIVETVSGLNVHEFSQKHIFAPLGMTETGYQPAEHLRVRAETTEQRDGKWIKGVVHDPRAYALGGIAGHAGLFSTTTDLAVFAQMMIQNGSLNDTQIISKETFQLMTSPHKISRGVRGLGWDKQSPYSSNRGKHFTSASFGHTGWTGTSIWIDPQLDLFVVFLSDCVHPNGKQSIVRVAGSVGTVVSEAVIQKINRESGVSEPESVLNGIDVLQRDNFAVLEGQKVGLITNHTGINLRGESGIQLLAKATNVELKALFSPEHGIAGLLDIPHIGDAKDVTTGLKVHSLYGANRKPTDESLKELDTLVFDIQDIGARFYTYISTMGIAMQTAAQHDIKFVVLDRTNPINGVDVQGPVLDEGKQSFIGFHTIPVRHGMTVGELALMMKAELKLDLDLQVVKVEGWDRANSFDSTGQFWVNPSPNMRCLTQALLYPGIGLLETTNLSVGRGTDTPFEIFGAPWIKGRELARRLNEMQLKGIRFIPIQFTPESSKFKNEKCQGVNMIIDDRSSFDPLETGFAIATTLRNDYQSEWNVESYHRLLNDDAVLQAIIDGTTVSELKSIYASELEQFKQRREAFLLY